MRQEKGDWKFFPEVLYNAIFSDQLLINGNLIIALEELPFQCFVLREETTFSFIAGEYTAPAGYILYENSEDEDGYTVVSPLNFLKDYVILK